MTKTAKHSSAPKARRKIHVAANQRKRVVQSAESKEQAAQVVLPVARAAESEQKLVITVENTVPVAAFGENEQTDYQSLNYSEALSDQFGVTNEQPANLGDKRVAVIVKSSPVEEQLARSQQIEREVQAAAEREVQVRITAQKERHEAVQVKISRHSSKVMTEQPRQQRMVKPQIIDSSNRVKVSSTHHIAVESAEEPTPADAITELSAAIESVVMPEAHPVETQKMPVMPAKPKKPAAVSPVRFRTNHNLDKRPLSQSAPRKQTARELKEQAIEKALVNASRQKPAKRRNRGEQVRFGARRVFLALACAAAAVFAIVYFVNLNTPNIPLKVAAMQSGIEAEYPSYVPRDYSLSDITSESGKITLNFRNATTGEAFSIIEEKSSWDSTALIENYVKGTYGDDYTVIREQGLTLYVSGSNASWMNGGVVYKLVVSSGSLTKKQIKAIAVSM